MPPNGAIDDEFFARSVEDFGRGDGDLDAVVGIRSFRISEGDEPPISRLELPSVCA